MSSGKNGPAKTGKSRPEPRTLNVRFIATLIVITAVLGGGVHLLHGAQVKRNAGGLKYRADVAFNDKKYDEAVTYYGRYLGFKPDDLESLTNYGLALDEVVKPTKSSKQLVRVYFALDRVVSRDAERDDIRRRVVEIAMDIGRFADAEHHLNYLLEQSSNDSELEHRLGECYEKTGRYQEAARKYESAKSHTPSQIESYERLAFVLRRWLDQPKVADQTIDSVVQGNGTFKAYLARARYYRQFGAVGDEDRLHKVVEDIKKARQLAPDDADVLLAAADLALLRAGEPGQLGRAVRQEDIDEARGMLQHGVELYPEDLRFYRALATLERQWGTVQNALKYLRQGLEVAPHQDDLLWLTADLLIDQGDLVGAKQQIDKLRLKEGMLLALIDYLEARWILKGESPDKWHKAAKKLEEIRPILAVKSPSQAREAELLLGVCYGALMDPDRQLSAYRRVAKAAPSWLPARFAVAGALLAQGKTEEALAEYRNLIRFGNAPVIVARILLERAQRTPMRERDWNEIESAINLANQAFPDSASVAILRGQMYAARQNSGDFDRAKAEFQSAIDRENDNVHCWIAFAGLASQRGEPQEALRILQEAQETLGDLIELRLARAQVILQVGGDQVEASLARLEQDDAKFTGEQLGALWAGLALVHFQLGNHVNALALSQRATEKLPNNLRLRFFVFDAATELGDQAAQAGAVEAIRQIEGASGPLASYVEGARIVRNGNQTSASERARARELLARAAAGRPQLAPVAKLQGIVEEMDGDFLRAIENYQKAIALGDRSSVLLQRTIQLLHEFGRFAEASDVLSKLDKDTPLSPDFVPIAFELYSQSGELTQALRLAERGVAENPQDFRRLLWLGQIHASLADRMRIDGDQASMKQHQKAAREAFERALELADSVPNTWEDLARFLARTGELADAKAVVERAKAKLTGERAIIVFARCYEAIGDLDRARDNYRQAIEASPDDPMILQSYAMFCMRMRTFQEAEPILQKLIDGSVATSQGTVAWARRSLAIVLVATRGVQRMNDVLPLIDRNIAEGTRFAEDLRLKGMLLAQLNSRRRQRDAIAVYEELIKLKTSIPSDRFVLAQLYDKHGHWPKAHTLLLTLVASRGRNPLYLSYFTRSLMRHSELDEAQRWMSRLDEVEPGTFVTVTTKARLLAALDRRDEAAKVMQAFLESDATKTGDESLARIRQNALDGKTDEAVAALDELLEFESDSFVRAVLGEARELCVQGKGLQAATLVQAQVQNDKVEAVRRTERVRVAATVFEELEDYTHAEELYRRYASLIGKPEGILVVAAYHGRHERIQQALDLCEEAAKTVPAEMVITTCLAILRAGKPTAAQVATVERRLDDALSQNPNDVAWLLRLADLRDLQEKADEAIAIYRKILKQDPQNVIALNNLAWLVAHQDSKGATEAVGFINRAIELAGPVVELLDTRGGVYMALGDPQKALADFEEAIDRTRPDASGAAKKEIHLANAYLELHDRIAAAAALRRARECGIEVRSMHYLERKQFEKLVAALGQK